MAKRNMMRVCFTPHSMMHSLFGLGVGVFIVSLFPTLGMWWLGIVLMVLAVAWDVMRK